MAIGYRRVGLDSEYPSKLEDASLRFDSASPWHKPV